MQMNSSNAVGYWHRQWTTADFDVTHPVLAAVKADIVSKHGA